MPPQNPEGPGRPGFPPRGTRAAGAPPWPGWPGGRRDQASQAGGGTTAADPRQASQAGGGTRRAEFKSEHTPPPPHKAPRPQPTLAPKNRGCIKIKSEPKNLGSFSRKLRIHHPDYLKPLPTKIEIPDIKLIELPKLIFCEIMIRPNGHDTFGARSGPLSAGDGPRGWLGLHGVEGRFPFVRLLW